MPALHAIQPVFPKVMDMLRCKVRFEFASPHFLLDPGSHRASLISSSIGPEIMDPVQAEMVTSTTSSSSWSSGAKRRPPKFTTQVRQSTFDCLWILF